MSVLGSLFSPEPPPNALRYAGAPGHVESYFIRANHPSRPLALWLKQTVLAPLQGPAVAESWLILFDGERQRTLAHRETQALSEARFEGAGSPEIELETRAFQIRLGERGAAVGRVNAPEGEARFELSWVPAESPVATPLSIFPYKLLRVGPFPKSKLLTPAPWLEMSGEVSAWGERWTLERWPGMQGHNWGKEHSFEYAWGQCLFPDEDAMVEGFTGRVKVAGRPSPRLSAAVVRRGGRSWRFDALFDTWRQSASLDGDRWSLALRGGDGELELEMDASGRPMVCLGYGNPDGELSYCFNSKLAEVKMTVRPSDAASFTCISACGGALEFLRRTPDPRFSRVV